MKVKIKVGEKGLSTRKIVVAAKEKEVKDVQKEEPKEDVETKKEVTVPLFKLRAIPTVNEDLLVNKLQASFLTPCLHLMSTMIDAIQGHIQPETMKKLATTQEKVKQQVIKKSKPFAKELSGTIAGTLAKIKLK